MWPFPSSLHFSFPGTLNMLFLFTFNLLFEDLAEIPPSPGNHPGSAEPSMVFCLGFIWNLMFPTFQ